MSFNEEYFCVSQILKSDIDRVRQVLVSDFLLQEPLQSKLYDILSSPSKNIRPLVSFLYLKASGYDITDEQVLYQSAIELVHNASLLHDDFLDESRIRRNKETLNSVFSDKVAVLSGDYVLSRALRCVLRVKNSQLTQLFCDTLEDMVKGEISQYFSLNKIPALGEYIRKSEQKTAKLFEMAIKGSMMIAGSKDFGIDFSKNFGIAFQIRDDLINCLTTKSDIQEGVYTAPVIFSGDYNDLKDGIEKTKSLLNNYIVRALKAIENIEDNEYKRALNKLTEILKYE